MDSRITYLMAQGELGGFEVVLEPQQGQPRRATPTAVVSVPTIVNDNDSLWKNSSNIDDFYVALQKHSVYTKSMQRSLSFCLPKEIKINVPFMLVFHSPQELTAEARGILERLFKKLGIDLNVCAVSFFFKCNDIAYPREKIILKEMLSKEIELINPKKIIFFREAPSPEKTEVPAKISDKPITLYSLLEMLPGKPEVKEKMNEVLNICQAQLL